MRFTIETKFNVGDTVYIADHYYDFYASKTPHIITDISIKVSTLGAGARYEIDGVDWLPRNWVFKTYEECVKWCEERNKEG